MRPPPRASIREVTPRSERGQSPTGGRWQRMPFGALLQSERRAFGFAIQGLRFSWRTQRHLRLHVALTTLVVALGLFLAFSPGEWAALIVTIALVTALELINTVVEVVVDLVTPEFHPLAKVAKDVAAAAVLVAACSAVLVGAIVLIPHFWRALHS